MLWYFEVFLYLFLLGICGVMVTSKHVIMSLIAIELMLLSANLIIILGSLCFDDILSHILFIVILTIGAAESSLGLSLMVLFFRLRGSISLNLLSLLKG